MSTDKQVPLTMSAERLRQIRNMAEACAGLGPSVDAQNELLTEVDAREAAHAATREQLGGTEEWWDQNSVQCGCCSIQIVTRGGDVHPGNTGLSHEEGEEEALCGYCAGEEVHRLIAERDALKEQLAQARERIDALEDGMTPQDVCNIDAALRAKQEPPQHALPKEKV